VWLAVSKPEYAEQFRRLLAAPWWLLGCLVGLSALTTALSGLVFWRVLSPVRRLRAADCVALNALATLVGYAPFKLGLVVRVLVNSRRDGLPLALIAAWVAATGVVLMASLAPAVGATLWLGDTTGEAGASGVLGPAWWGVALGGLTLVGAAIVLAARWAAGEAGWALLQRVAGATRVSFISRLASSSPARTLHGGAAMLASPAAVTHALVLRCADIAAQALRFWLAGQAVGVTVSPDQAVLAGAAYFVLQAISPAGTLGAREAGTAGLLSFLHSPDMMLVVLVVSMAQAASDITLGTAGAAWLRIDRLLRPARRGTGDGARRDVSEN
jgi:hypothetical protein